MRETRQLRFALLRLFALVLSVLLGGACAPEDLVVSPLGTVVVGPGGRFRSGRWRR